MADTTKLNKHKYNLSYKKEHFDNIAFYAPKGTKEKINECAKAKGVTLSEYMRQIVTEAISRPRCSYWWKTATPPVRTSWP